MMHPQKTPHARWLAISGATLALVIAGGAVVSAHPNEDGGRGYGRDRGGPQFGAGQPFEPGAGRMGQGMPWLRGALGDAADAIVRRETTLQTDAGVITQRVDHGTAVGTTDTTIEYTLATGEVVTLALDDETQVIAFSEDTLEVGRRSRTRMIPAEIAISDVTLGSQIGVWAESQDDGTFLAQRIVVRPELIEAATDDADAEAEAAASDDAANVPATEA